MHVSLAPVTADLVGDLATWREDASQRSEFDDFGPEEPGRLARAFAHTGLPNLLLVMVTASDPPGGHLAGMVSWRASQYGPNAESQGWNIGVSLKPQYRGAGIGTAAHRLLVGHLFATTDVLRLEAGTDITNAPERGSPDHGRIPSRRRAPRCPVPPRGVPRHGHLRSSAV